MGARWSRNSLDVRIKRMQNVHNRAHRRIQDNMEEIAKEGASEMQEHIADRGTSWSEYRFFVLGQGRSEGREDTGKMMDAVEYRTSAHPTVVNAEFGWLEEYELYFTAQEKGTAQIEAMFALRDASTTAKQKLKDLGPEIIDDAKRYL